MTEPIVPEVDLSDAQKARFYQNKTEELKTHLEMTVCDRKEHIILKARYRGERDAALAKLKRIRLRYIAARKVKRFFLRLLFGKVERKKKPSEYQAIIADQSAEIIRLKNELKQYHFSITQIGE
jgi:hypothetical protein